MKYATRTQHLAHGRRSRGTIRILIALSLIVILVVKYLSWEIITTTTDLTAITYVGPLMCNGTCSWDEVHPHRQPTFAPQRTTAKGNVSRVIFMVISTHLDEFLCQNVASAYLSGVPVVAVGVNASFHYSNKMDLIMEAADLAGIEDSDVVAYIDRDTVFTGTDPFLFLDDFIDRSPRTLAELNVRSVRASQAIAPFLIGSENGCYAWQVYSDGKVCEHFARAMPEFLIKQYAHLLGYDDIPYDIKRFNTSIYPMQYINSGVVVARRWALEEVSRGMKSVLQSGRQNLWSHGNYSCDQSMFHLLYHDLMQFEVQTDAAFRPAVMAKSTSQFGLHAGLMDFDYRQRASTISEVSDHVRINLRYWQDVPIPVEARFGLKYFYRLREEEKTTAAAQGILLAFLRSTGAPLTLEKRDVSFLHTDIQQVNVAPPMIGSKSSTTGPPSFPFLLHCSDYDKMRRLQYYSLFTSWALPIQTSRADYMRARQLLQSSSITYVTSSLGKGVVQYVSYADTCLFPFTEWRLVDAWR